MHTVPPEGFLAGRTLLVSADAGQPHPARLERRTRRSVYVADRVARTLIACGGILTVVSVFGVLIYLCVEVLPLFRAERITRLARWTVPEAAVGETASQQNEKTDNPSDSRAAGDAPAPPAGTPAAAPAASASRAADIAGGDATIPVAQPVVGLDDHALMYWVLHPLRRKVVLHRAGSGEVLAQFPVGVDKPVSASTVNAWTGDFALGFADGTVQMGSLSFNTEYLDESVIGRAEDNLKPGAVRSYRNGLLERTSDGQLRHHTLVVEQKSPVVLARSQRILLLDGSQSTRGSVLVALTADGSLRYARVTERRNLLTGEITTRLKEGRCSVDLQSRGMPAHLLVAGLGDNVFLLFSDGRLLRFDTRDPSTPRLVEECNLLSTSGVHVTGATFLIGKTSLAVADSTGNIGIWFRIKPEDATTPDGVVLVCGHRLPGGSAAVTALAPSLRSRILAAGYADGSVRLFHVTSEQLLATASLAAQSDTVPFSDSEQQPAPVARAVAMGPKDDRLLALSGSGGVLWDVRAPHPEITWRSIFCKVWYEGYNEPEHVWQSSSGSDDFEPKYGLMPLIFGTIKATFYSMLFGAPLALLAAVYTSEFLHPRWKKRVKPTIEVMASLPSVVLGFLAALFFAPIVERIVPETLTALATTPFAVLLGAHLWRLLPASIQTAWRAARIPLVAVWMALGLLAAGWLGPVVERTLFAGDVMLWLDGQIGTGTAGWMLLCLPASAAVMALLCTWWVAPAIRRALRGQAAWRYSIVALGQFLAGTLVVLALAWLAAAALNEWAWDPRGTFVGTYVQRNAFVVGIVMGFAVIPIIYTVSDDALSAVPESLRAASAGAGATQWQTALRIVVPTAMSGLFSALMIGLGRAVGETMIVLMAAGNTPIIDWNVFSGFRTLSANIAVEMPEAVKGSTHFRMLFLAALALFLMTFVVNTIAESIRLRFRKRAFEL